MKLYKLGRTSFRAIKSKRDYFRQHGYTCPALLLSRSLFLWRFFCCHLVPFQLLCVGWLYYHVASLWELFHAWASFGGTVPNAVDCNRQLGIAWLCPLSIVIHCKISLATAPYASFHPTFCVSVNWIHRYFQKFIFVLLYFYFLSTIDIQKNFCKSIDYWRDQEYISTHETYGLWQIKLCLETLSGGKLWFWKIIVTIDSRNGSICDQLWKLNMGGR